MDGEAILRYNVINNEMMGGCKFLTLITASVELRVHLNPHRKPKVIVIIAFTLITLKVSVK